MNIMPPGYQDREGRWFKIWKKRLETIEHQMFPWRSHPDFDEYWQSKVIRIEKIDIPTFLIGGWRDLFPQAMVHIYEKLSVPKKLFMGPWMHNPMDVTPQEPWDYLYELKRWWDFWLKNEKNGMMDDPPVTIFIQGAKHWRNEEEWPIGRTKMQTLYLSGGETLRDHPAQKEGSETYYADPTVGINSSLWDPVSRGIGLPSDQGRDDLLSLTFTSEPLSSDTEITGSPEATIYTAIEDGEEINLVAKLNDISPTGRSSLITTGWLKGNHFRSHAQREHLQRGRVYRFIIPLWATSYFVPKGHRLRLSVSCSDFPRIWPIPTNPKIRLFFGDKHSSSLRIPVVPSPTIALPVPMIRRPDPAVNRAPAVTHVTPQWKIERDLVTGMIRVLSGNELQLAIPGGMKIKRWHTLSIATVSAAHPEKTSVEGKSIMLLELPSAGRVEIRTKTWISHDRMIASGNIKLNGKIFFEKKWKR
jgi:putative CocE/NonD family hydrolase